MLTVRFRTLPAAELSHRLQVLKALGGSPLPISMRTLVLVFALALGSMCSGAAPSAALPRSTNLTIPGFFEENKGQTDGRAKFLSRRAGYSVFVTREGLVLSLAPSSGKKHAALRMTVSGANPDAKIEGEAPLPGRSNYLRGGGNLSDIRQYERVRVRDVRPGIDLVFYGDSRELEYDLVLKPGSEPKALKVRFEGQDKLALDGSGDIVLKTAAGDLRQRKPRVWQEVDGKRSPVEASYLLARSGEVRLKLGRFDTTRPLVVDPVISYSSYFPYKINGIAAGPNGELYATGYVEDDTFPVTPGAYDNTLGFADAFVLKINSAGSALVYATYLGGSGWDEGRSIAVNPLGQAYVSGNTVSRDFPATWETRTSIHGLFVTKLNSAGSGYLYSAVLYGGTQIRGNLLAIDPTGSAYVAGSASSFPSALKTYRASPSGGEEIIVAKLDPSGTALLFSTFLGGSNDETPYGLAVDRNEDVYITGQTSSADFPAKGGLGTTLSGSTDAFVTKLRPSASGDSALVYSTYLGGTDDDCGSAIAVDTAGSAYVTGWTVSRDFPTTPSAYSRIPGDSYEYGDVFVTKLDANGASLSYSTYLGGSRNDSAIGIAVDQAGNVILAGSSIVVPRFQTRQ
jgi:hypothetical protein